VNGAANERDARTTAVVYLARGADHEWFASFQRFLASYQKFPAGREHALYILYKGFESKDDLDRAMNLFSAVNASGINLDDYGLDIGAYLIAANELVEDQVCFLNTHSEILAPGWLEKLARHLERPEVGLVGATGSFESLSPLASQFPSFPNIHLRSNAFLIERELFNSLVGGSVIHQKLDAFFVESGLLSLTRQVLKQGLMVLVVGRNGRGYPPRWWSSSNTYRQGLQANLLVGDNVTGAYMPAPWEERRALVERTWGEYLDPCNAFVLEL